MNEQPSSTDLAFGQYLRSKREAKGMTIRQVALYSGVSKSSISMMERGHCGKRFNPMVLKKLSRPLGVPYEVLMNAAGHNEIVPIDDDDEESVPVMRLLRESLGDSIELFSERVGLGLEEVMFLENHQVSAATLRTVFAHLFRNHELLSSNQKQLLLQIEEIFLSEPAVASSLERVLQAVLELSRLSKERL